MFKVIYVHFCFLKCLSNIVALYWEKGGSEMKLNGYIKIWILQRSVFWQLDLQTEPVLTSRDEPQNKELFNAKEFFKTNAFSRHQCEATA